jgi:hypothetical protein
MVYYNMLPKRVFIDRLLEPSSLFLKYTLPLILFLPVLPGVSILLKTLLILGATLFFKGKLTRSNFFYIIFPNISKYFYLCDFFSYKSCVSYSNPSRDKMKIENILNPEPVPGPAPEDSLKVPVHKPINYNELITSTPTPHDFDELNRIYWGLYSKHPSYIIGVANSAWKKMRGVNNNEIYKYNFTGFQSIFTKEEHSVIKYICNKYNITDCKNKDRYHAWTSRHPFEPYSRCNNGNGVLETSLGITGALGPHSNFTKDFKENINTYFFETRLGQN